MGHLVDRPLIVTSIETRGRVLAVVTTARIMNTPDGVERVIMFRDVLSVFRPLRAPSDKVPVNLDAKIALVYREIEEAQVAAVEKTLDFINVEGFLAFDMATGRAFPPPAARS